MSTTTGLIGEYQAAAIVLSLGWRVSMCPQDKVDLLAWKDDEFIRIQVKTASLLLQKGKRLPCYHFQFGHGRQNKIIGSVKDYDILCQFLRCNKSQSACRLSYLMKIKRSFIHLIKRWRQ